ncbi:2-oxoglutarate dehydrogenase E1 component [Sandaracinobacter sp. RS1-74]|uniref:2-oxoglutarate dehydrogenase E1 component n=1 Tax=Sandaracinobacteroides sayramensis TaxID=2913411 RepID=UPI001EDAC7E2|nr:2-oxoglutarate dehydrogenase E1 component [Sandaracinobacteroides sayramensis]MCG2841572.1 2-oxoglutarate dehydrogenase E1 component [Sandaracinobacteroides sayramensis]
MQDEQGYPDTLPRPSWARPDWPLTPDDELTLALDAGLPGKAAAAVARASGKPAPAASSEDAKRAAQDTVKATMLIRTYRVRGHLAANLDPLGLAERPMPADLTPEYHGLTDPNRTVFIGGLFGGLETVTVAELVEILRRNYCGHVGLEYMHINDVEERRFLQERFEGRDKEIQFTPEGKKAILNKLIEAEQFEKFLARKYVGTKRFGLEGGEAAIPALESIIKVGGAQGVNEIVIGMPHRGRLNVLANVMQKPFKVIFHEFSGGSSNPDDVGGSGDVKYHLGASTDRAFDGNHVHLSLAPNPSHLEAVNPVVLGKARATQRLKGVTEAAWKDLQNQVLPVLLHGDAAFAGQGIVAECLGFSGVPGYSSGGTLHFIVNNQVGFTTSPAFARSSPYPSDVAKLVQAPIFHVYGDDPEAVTFATKVATEFRQAFHRDVVIDMWCYRRFGHNESDEPAFTQPLMYAKIRDHKSVATLYGERLVAEGHVTAYEVAAMEKAFVDRLEADFEAASSFRPEKAEWFGGRWQGLHQPADPVTARRSAETGVAEDALRAIAQKLHTVPEGFNMHRTLERVVKARAVTIEAGEGIDWATAESLAFGTLVGNPSSGSYGVRLSGQDSGRGTFSQRHAVWVDQKTGQKYIPLNDLGGDFEVYDSPLSEFGVLGFEYGYAMADPRKLVLWEAQFGDFANGAQVIIDQFIASGEAKWLRANGLVMLLPHGYEGQGPEHSSARLERYLQLCAEDNIQVANCTTPANYFHILRRQMLRPFRKPLIIMTPKSLLRHKRAVSTLADMGAGSSFHRCLDDQATVDPAKVKRLILCSGKVYYDLADERDAQGREDVYILRVEQLYPFPGDTVAEYAKRFANLETVVWCQEEPKNAGSWFFVDPLIEEALGQRAVYAGRAAAAATATGLARRHAAEQTKLIHEALGEDKKAVRAAIRSSLKSSATKAA